jgi:7-cyano-7-deazaguanine synthase
VSSAILLSGGMDSIALAYWKRPKIAVTVDYGQVPASAEIAASKRVCEELTVRHIIIEANLRHLGSGDLAGAAPVQLAPCSEWWPYRNQMLVTLAAMRLLPEGSNSLLIGTVASDGVHHDGTEKFVNTLDNLLRAQEGEMRLQAPALTFTSDELIRKSGIPPEILAWAHSCHTQNLACGMCRGCNKHRETWSRLGYVPY